MAAEHSAAPAAGRDALVAAALRLFADHGSDATSVRDIAAKAEVSPALVMHHFGSKAGLKTAVDEHVAAVFASLGEAEAVEALTVREHEHDGTNVLSAGFVQLLLDGLPPGSPIPAYLRRLLLEGDPAGHEIFARWLDASRSALKAMEGAGLARASADPEVRAAFLMVNDLAMILLHDHIARATGVDPLTHDGLHRWSADVLDAYTDGVFRKEPA
ncbi:TetR/AcrR family transcriptional regulator [Demequina sp. NBRC 110056]|uniref:TetR/AcrR family transcriptional regulator n=1 Tax=Demequina sp. NBRC 110056 TaxID=1570345 RepID=UPI000A00D7BF|nr:TetR/AcrR family transcriptional regulator [Demequina sp. NBRC 110056]